VLFGNKSQPLLGLDITTSSVKLIELSQSGKRYRVESYSAEPTPPSSVSEKAIVDAKAVGEAIRRAVKRAGAKATDVAVAISGDAAITKIIQMPSSLSERDLEGQVEIQADQYIPFPMEEVSFDYEVIGPNDKDPELMDVLLVATRTENVNQRQAAVSAAGLSTQVVDVEAFALENACRLLSHQIPDGGIGQSVAVVDIGASSTTFSVLQDLKVVYTRDFNFGGQQLTEEIMRTYGLSMEDAGRAKKQGGLPSNYQPEVLEPFIDDMTQQVSRSLQFYLASGGGREQPDMILVCGGCANIPGISDVISSRVGIPTEVGDPLGQMKISSKAKSQGVNKDATALLTAGAQATPTGLRSRHGWRRRCRSRRRDADDIRLLADDLGPAVAQRALDGGNCRAREEHRGNRRPGAPEGAAPGTHGNYRPAAEEPPGSRSSV
jgi:type IV pilus assembly protein PilM